MANFRVLWSERGWAYITAETKEEAEEKFWDRLDKNPGAVRAFSFEVDEVEQIEPVWAEKESIHD